MALETTALKHPPLWKSPRRSRKWDSAGSSHGLWACRAFPAPLLHPPLPHPRCAVSLSHLQPPGSCSPDAGAPDRHTVPVPEKGPTPNHPLWACTIPQQPPPPPSGLETESVRWGPGRESMQKASWRQRSPCSPEGQTQLGAPAGLPGSHPCVSAAAGSTLPNPSSSPGSPSRALPGASSFHHVWAAGVRAARWAQARQLDPGELAGCEQRPRSGRSQGCFSRPDTSPVNKQSPL